MPDKLDKKLSIDDPEFQVSEDMDSSSPNSAPGPDWQSKSPESAAKTPASSLVEISLDEEQPETPAVKSNAPPSPPAGAPKPPPVDLSPELAVTPLPRKMPPAFPARRTPPAEPPPAQSGAPAKPLRPTQEIPPPGTEAVPEETAFERDARRRSAATLDNLPTGEEETLDRARPGGLTGQVVSDGRTLRFSDGLRFAVGDLVVCHDRRFRVKLLPRRPWLLYAKGAGLLILVLLASVGVSTLFSGSPTGSITGVVVDAATGRIIPGAEVRLRGGMTAGTNVAGMYTFSGLTPGTYEIRVSMPGYGDRAQTVARTGTQDATLPFALDPLYAATPQEPARAPGTKNEPVADKEKPAESGTLKLTVDFTGFILYLDDKIVGKDVTKVAKIDPGEHKVMLEKEQYEEYRTSVTVKPRRTAELTISLQDLKAKTTHQQRARERFAEGKAALDADRYQDAVQAFDAALAEQAEYAEARQYRGWAFRKLGNAEEATKDLKAAAELYALSNRYLEAVTCVNFLVEMYPGRGEFLLMRGNYHTALGELKPAITDYEAAVNTDDKSLRFRLALAEGYYRAGQYKEAAREFEKARKMANEPSDIYVRLILSYLYAGKDKDVIKRYHELAALAPPDKMAQLRQNPEWQRVLQLVGPDEKLKNQ